MDWDIIANNALWNNKKYYKNNKINILEQCREYNRQKGCAIRGYTAKVKPSEHFLFDFDLEQMLKDNVYRTSGNGKCTYITKWWDGTIRHWTVNDGIWKDKRWKQCP